MSQIIDSIWADEAGYQIAIQTAEHGGRRLQIWCGNELLAQATLTRWRCDRLVQAITEAK